jgi:hypothetical protein
MTSTCRAAGALALGAVFAATASAAGAVPTFTLAELHSKLDKCEARARGHGPGVYKVNVGHGGYAITVVYLGPALGTEDDALIEVIKNGAPPERIEKPIFTLVCINGKVRNDPQGNIHLWPGDPKELRVAEVLDPTSLVISRWYERPLQSICITKPTGTPASTAPIPPGQPIKACWPWAGLPDKTRPKILMFRIPYQPGKTWDYMLHVRFMGEDIPVDPQIINH